MANIRSIVNIHNKEVITEKKTQAVNCNCMNKPDCIIYKAKITSNLRNFHGKIYHGTSKHTFKQRYGLSKEYWRLKELRAQPHVQFYILKRCRPTKRTSICYLCLNE